jgi:DNA-binding FadR family transcriptional regulator
MSAGQNSGAEPTLRAPNFSVSSLSTPVDVVFAPVRSGNTFEETVERLLQSIKLGVVGYGERLPSERDLADRLGISRVTLREAIRSLQQAGYVESRRGRSGGTFVTYRPVQPRRRNLKRLTKDLAGPLADTLVLRRVLEAGAAEAAAGQSLDDEAAAYLEQRLTDVDKAGLLDYRQADSHLHLVIAQLTGSSSLATAAASVRMRLNDLLDAIPLLEVNLAHSNLQHRSIVEAILAGDKGRARVAMEEHVDATAALLRGFLG